MPSDERNNCQCMSSVNEVALSLWCQCHRHECTAVIYNFNAFKRCNLKIAYTTKKCVQKNLNPKTHISNKYLASGLYKLTYTDCGI